MATPEEKIAELEVERRGLILRQGDAPADQMATIDIRIAGIDQRLAVLTAQQGNSGSINFSLDSYVFIYLIYFFPFVLVSPIFLVFHSFHPC
jgi:hypothetical protein